MWSVNFIFFWLLFVVGVGVVVIVVVFLCLWCLVFWCKLNDSIVDFLCLNFGGVDVFDVKGKRRSIKIIYWMNIIVNLCI